MDDKEVTNKVLLQLHKQIKKQTYIDLFEENFFSLNGKNYLFNYITEEELEDRNDIINNTIEWNTNLNKNLNFDNYVVGELID